MHRDFHFLWKALRLVVLLWLSRIIIWYRNLHMRPKQAFDLQDGWRVWRARRAGAGTSKTLCLLWNIRQASYMKLWRPVSLHNDVAWRKLHCSGPWSPVSQKGYFFLRSSPAFKIPSISKYKGRHIPNCRFTNRRQKLMAKTTARASPCKRMLQRSSISLPSPATSLA